MISHIDTLKAAQSCLWQYLDDLQRPPTGDSLDRRIAAARATSQVIAAALAQMENDDG